MGDVDLIIRFLASAQGREKSLRLGQYALMFLSRLSREESWLNKQALNISAHLSLIRKVMRFGVPISKIV
jgi:hypothetical protein